MHPLAAQRVAELDGQPLAGITQAPVIADDPALNRRLAQFLLERNRITAKIVEAFTANDVEAARAATEELAALQHADTGLVDDLARYEASLSRLADDTTDAKPAKPRRKPKP